MLFLFFGNDGLNVKEVQKTIKKIFKVRTIKQGYISPNFLEYFGKTVNFH